jgi:hypothetical protein
MTNRTLPLSRRTFLRGLGTVMALPMLEAMAPAATTPASSFARVATGAPRRLAFVYLPNGINMEDWTPRLAGANYELPMILKPLQPVKNFVSVLSGLAHVKARSNGDGPGDHARANATFLTGVQARKTSGADIRAGVSVDQIAAAAVGRLTRLPSLELSCDRVRNAGSCDSGYSCAYQYNIAWKSPTTPMPPLFDPRLAFERLFGAGGAEQAEARARRARYNKSILDLVMDDAKALRGNLGTTDQRKLDEYLASIREIEVQIEQSEKFAAAQPRPDLKRPDGVPQDYGAHLRLMYDIMAVAFQTDTTRIATFMTAHDGSNRPYPFIGVTEGHHDLSHHGNNPEKKAKIAKINQFHLTQFAYFLGKFRSIREGNGTLLDNSMIVLGSAIADGNRHAHHDLPVLLAGAGGGALKPGRHVQFPTMTPMSNLFVSLLDRAGAPVGSFGDSNGRTESI